jgi:CBS domain-containing protein
MAATRPTAAGRATRGATPRHQDLTARPVDQIMSTPVFSVTADLRLVDALAAMVRTRLRHLVVVDDAGRCRGVVADRTITAAWAIDPTALSLTPIGRILDKRLAVVGAEATVAEVAQAMHTDAVDAVAVIDRTGCPVGLVTGGDLVALLATEVNASRTTTADAAEASS